MKKLFVLFLLLMPAIAIASGQDTHGGDGVKIHDSVYLLDFVEQGVELEPYFNPSIQADADVKRRVEAALADIDNAPNELVSRKISEIMAADKLLGLSLLKSIEMHVWKLVRFDLVNVPDEDTIATYGSLKLIQLAIRRMQGISIAREYWQQLTPEHRAGLIFHEAVYALIQPFERQVTLPDGKIKKTISQDSVKAREINGYLFTKSLTTRAGIGLRSLLRYDDKTDYLPLGGTRQVDEHASELISRRYLLLNIWINGDFRRIENKFILDWFNNEELAVSVQNACSLWQQEHFGFEDMFYIDVWKNHANYAYKFSSLTDSDLGTRVYLQWILTPNYIWGTQQGITNCAEDTIQQILNTENMK